MINRKQYNLEILNKLQEFLQKNPDFRFIQALWALDIVDRDENNTIIDRFYEEPNITLEKVDKRFAEFKGNKKNDIFAENSIQQTAFLYDSLVAVGKLTGKEYTNFLNNMTEQEAKYRFLKEQEREFWDKMKHYNHSLIDLLNQIYERTQNNPAHASATYLRTGTPAACGKIVCAGKTSFEREIFTREYDTLKNFYVMDSFFCFSAYALEPLAILGIWQRKDKKYVISLCRATEDTEEEKSYYDAERNAVIEADALSS